MMNEIRDLVSVFGIFVCLPAFSQPRINWVACVLPNFTYQYTIGDSSVSTRQINMQICIRGGSLVDRNGNRLNNCTVSTEPLSTILVMWNEAVAGSVIISTSEGKRTLNVGITSSLQGGLVDTLIKEQNFSDTLSIPSPITCSVARGGSCSPKYSYQWQQSQDAMTWTNISGSIRQNLSFSSPVKRSSYYRRSVIETGSGTIAYSDIGTISILSNTSINRSLINDVAGKQTSDNKGSGLDLFDQFNF